MFIISHVPEVFEPILYSIFNFLLLSSLSLHLVLSKIDPSGLFSKTSLNPSETSLQFRCTICEVAIDFHSKHCSSCNKCIFKYDHHCAWINNCIGGKNYSLFFLLVVCTTALSVSVTVSGLVAVINTLCFEERFDTDLEIAYVFFIVITETFGFISCCYFGFVLGFHCYLMCKGISTFEYVTNKAKSVKVLPRPLNGWERTESVNQLQEIPRFCSN
jgi:hypothetical protein